MRFIYNKKLQYGVFQHIIKNLYGMFFV